MLVLSLVAYTVVNQMQSILHSTTWTCTQSWVGPLFNMFIRWKTQAIFETQPAAMKASSSVENLEANSVHDYVGQAWPYTMGIIKVLKPLGACKLGPIGAIIAIASVALYGYE